MRGRVLHWVWRLCPWVPKAAGTQAWTTHDPPTLRTVELGPPITHPRPLGRTHTHPLPITRCPRVKIPVRHNTRAHCGTHSANYNYGCVLFNCCLQHLYNISSFFSAGWQHFDSLKADKMQKLNMLFACAVHQTATPYSPLLTSTCVTSCTSWSSLSQIRRIGRASPLSKSFFKQSVPVPPILKARMLPSALSVYACFVAIKYHLKKLDGAVK